MTFSRLSETEAGKVVLANLKQTSDDALLPQPVLVEFLRLLYPKLASLPARYSWKQLRKQISDVVYTAAWKYQAAAGERPAADLSITAIQSLAQIYPLLNKIRKVHGEPSIGGALARSPTTGSLHRAAHAINTHAARMPQLTIGMTWNLFWASTTLDVVDIETSAPLNPRYSLLPPDARVAHALRDNLGLAHLKVVAGSPLPLFAFEAKVSLDDLRLAYAFRMSRPTTLDGFDNRRFRQLRPPAARARAGCGLTVDLGGGTFQPGAPEVVSTEIPITTVLHCRYVGKLIHDAAGTDTAFTRFVTNAIDINATALELDRLTGLVP